MLHSTPAEINLALDGKIDFIKKTNPWGSGEGKDQDKGADDVAQGLAQVLRGNLNYRKD